MYDQSSESNLNYHELLAEFLEHLCERTSKGEPLTPTAPSGAQAGQIVGDEIYCTTATRFRADQTTPPVVALLTQTVRTKERAGVRIKLSKVSTVSMTIELGEKTVWTNRATVEGGKPRLLWVTPSKPGVYGVILRATDLAGNEEVTSGSITVKKAPKAKKIPKGHHKAVKASASGRISPPARRLPAF
jgi:hypothetical protein